MTDGETPKTASEIINQFFASLKSLERMDKDTALILQRLWKEGNLGRDELLLELENERNKGRDNGS